VWGTAAWWNNNLYFGVSDDNLSSTLSTRPAAHCLVVRFRCSQLIFGYPGPTPSISANGNSDAIVWALQTDSWKNSRPGTLHACDATDIGNELYNSGQRF
jgi:hypothetical protein